MPNPFIHSDFKLLTAVRLSRDAGGVAEIKINRRTGSTTENDAVHGRVFIGGNELRLDADFPAGRIVTKDATITVVANHQAHVAVLMGNWESDACFAAQIIPLGSYCPLDVTNDADGKEPVGRILRWVIPNKPIQPPERKVVFTFQPDGLLKWDQRLLSSEYQIAPNNELHIVFGARVAGAGSIEVAAEGANPTIKTEI